MFDANHNRLAALVDEITDVMQAVVEADGMFCQVRAQVRAVATNYPEFLVFSPELRNRNAVADIWDRSWKPLTAVSMPVSQRMISAPMW